MVRETDRAAPHAKGVAGLALDIETLDDAGRVGFIDQAVAVVVATVAALGGRRDHLPAADDGAVYVADRQAAGPAVPNPFDAEAADAEVFIGDAVAVVVELIAGLVLGGEARSLADAKSAQATASHETFGQADPHTHGAAHLEALVPRAVAVIVEAVAELAARENLAGTEVPQGRRPAALPTVEALPHPALLRLSCPAVATLTCLAGVAERDRLINTAIAVVVDGVADLLPIGRHAGPEGPFDADLAAGVAGSTGARPAVAREGDALEALVRAVVAVVVDGVALLGTRGPGHGVAHDPLAAAATGDPARSAAGADPDGAGLLQKESLVGAAVTVVVEGVTDLDTDDRSYRIADDLLLFGAALVATFGDAGAALDCTDREHPDDVVIDRAVAVVVEAVAGLGGGPDLAVAAAKRALRRIAGLRPDPTLTDAVQRGLSAAVLHLPGGAAAITRHLVNATIAVIVQTVAVLGRWQNLAAALAPVSAAADLDALLAGSAHQVRAVPAITSSGQAEVAAEAAVVEVLAPIAVVVAPVAGLCGGHDLPNALPPVSVHAGPGSTDAGAAVERGHVPVITRLDEGQTLWPRTFPLIGLAITVVVHPVAGLFCGGQARRGIDPSVARVHVGSVPARIVGGLVPIRPVTCASVRARRVASGVKARA